MSAVIALKLICDMCFYLTFAGFIGGLAGGVGVLPAFPFLAAATYLCCVLRNKKLLRFPPLLLLAAIPLFLNVNLAGYIVLAPPAVYLIVNVACFPPDTSDLSYGGVFSLFLKLLIPFSVVVVFIARWALESSSLPYALIFLAGAIILMRMLRHEPEILEQLRFKLMNSISVFAVIIAGALFSSQAFLTVVKTLLGGLYVHVIMPVLMAITRVLLFILSPLSLFELKPPENDLSGDMEIGVPDDMDWGEIKEAGIGPTIIRYVVYAIIAAIAVFLIVKLVKKLRGSGRTRRVASGVAELRVAVDGNQKRGDRRARMANPIRETYRKFMLLCEKEGIEILPASTTRDISDAYGNIFGELDSSQRLRDIYIESRYGEKAADKAEVKECKDIYTKFNKKNAT
ncbi:MAG: DUF4129 domain-containing protein [Oscillospiraceae bacterium]|jgi:hypothetical protein|nr:DUF4129 domain-containing protein [Oscillospiraceae bacterium]